MALGRRPRDVLKAEATVFPYTGRPKLVNNIFTFPNKNMSNGFAKSLSMDSTSHCHS